MVATVVITNPQGSVLARERYPLYSEGYATLPAGDTLTDKSRCQWFKEWPRITLPGGAPLKRFWTREGDAVTYGDGFAYFDGVAVTNTSRVTERVTFEFVNGCRK